MDINFDASTVLFFLATFLLIGNTVLLVLCFSMKTRRTQIMKIFTAIAAIYSIVIVLYLAVTTEETTVISSLGCFDIERIIIAINAIISILISLTGVYLLTKKNK